jgi:hypothetical protein
MEKEDEEGEEYDKVDEEKENESDYRNPRIISILRKSFINRRKEKKINGEKVINPIFLPEQKKEKNDKKLKKNNYF